MKIASTLVSNTTMTVFFIAGAFCISSPTSFCAAPHWVTWDALAGGNGHQYLAVPGYAGLTWDEANTRAQAAGGYLASVTSAAENNFVFGLVNSPEFFNSFNGAGPAIGGYLNDPKRGWHWTSGEAWSYTNWASGLPNNGSEGHDKLTYYSGIPNTPAATWDDVERNDAGGFGVGLGGYVVELEQQKLCSNAPSGTISWWKAENNALDVVSGNNGFLRGGVTFAKGKVGKAFAFNGTDSFVEVPDASSLRLTNELTIEFWIKRRQLVDTDDYVVNKGGDWSGGALNYGVSIARDNLNNVFHFLYAGGLQGTISIADLKGHHCAVTARHGDTNATFYVDGVQQPILLRNGASEINLYPSTEPLRIGAQVDSIASYYSHALIDELGIYDRVLSANEIRDIYISGSAGKLVGILAGQVMDSDLSARDQRKLLVTLNVIRLSLEKKQFKPALVLIQVFERQVKKLVQHVDQSLADQLIDGSKFLACNLTHP